MDLSFDTDDLAVLSDLGLSHSQSKVYLALLKLGTDSKAVSVFRLSRIARQDVYRILTELQRAGIVEKIISRPVRFRAVEPKKAVSILLERKTNALTDLNKKAKSFIERASAANTKLGSSYDKDKILLISEKRALINKCQEEIGKAAKNVDFMAPSNEFPRWVNALSDAFALAASKGARGRWLIDKPSEQELWRIQRLLSDNPSFTVKYAKRVPQVKFGIFDGKSTIFAIFRDRDFAESPALWSNSTTVVELVKSYFESYWENGIELRSKA